MLGDECVHERTERENLQASAADILEGFAYEDRSDSMSLERILNFRMHERDHSRLRAVGGEARQLAIHRSFVTVLVWIVVDLHGHDHDATPRQATRRKVLLAGLEEGRTVPNVQTLSLGPRLATGLLDSNGAASPWTVQSRFEPAGTFVVRRALV